MKNDEGDPFFEKYFNFFKMDKKNVQIRIDQNTLTDEKFRLDKKFLSSQIKPKFFILWS
jgi:hypothetical protein